MQNLTLFVNVEVIINQGFVESVANINGLQAGLRLYGKTFGRLSSERLSFKFILRSKCNTSKIILKVIWIPNYF